MKYNVLFVDDEERILQIIEKSLSDLEEMNILTASCGQIALDIMELTTVDLIVTDLKMPGMSGTELLKVIKDKYPDTYRILLTGNTDINETIEAINKGEIIRFIKKPWDIAEFKQIICEVVEYINLKRQNVEMNRIITDQNQQLKELNKRLEEKVQLRTRQIKELQQVTIFALAHLAESRDPETGSHLERIRRYVLILAKKLSEKAEYAHYIDEQYLDNIYESSPLHDIGKVGIPDNILLKPGRLTPEEFEIMKTHTIIGSQTLAQAECKLISGEKKTFLSMGKIIALYHHEKWNGMGYPQGLKGEQIPLTARIVALADVYDALRSKRVYKEAMDHDEAAGIIIKESGTSFDPAIVKVFKSIESEFIDISKEFNEQNKILS